MNWHAVAAGTLAIQQSRYISNFNYRYLFSHRAGPKKENSTRLHCKKKSLNTKKKRAEPKRSELFQIYCFSLTAGSPLSHERER